MDETKSALLKASYHEEEERKEVPPNRFSRTFRFCLAAAIVYGILTAMASYAPQGGFLRSTERMPCSDHTAGASKIPLEAHIMSKCPDARDCLRDLILPAMQNISHKVDFTLSYIGTLIDHDDDVECKHGPGECLGNILELCAAQLHHDPMIYLGFAMCLSDDGSHIPQRELVHNCALEHGIDFDDLNDCASKDDGSFGMDLLRQSVARSAQANVSTSCTIRLNDKVRCIRDSGEWKDCRGGHSVEDLVRDVNELSALYSFF